jgi:hypothetical protein
MEASPEQMKGRKESMYPYTNEIKELQDAMQVARTALVSLHNKYQTNGLPFAIANALELDLANLLSTVTVIKDMASHERIRYATYLLQAEGYEVKAPKY